MEKPNEPTIKPNEASDKTYALLGVGNPPPEEPSDNGIKPDVKPVEQIKPPETIQIPEPKPTETPADPKVPDEPKPTEVEGEAKPDEAKLPEVAPEPTTVPDAIIPDKFGGDIKKFNASYKELEGKLSAIGNEKSKLKDEKKELQKLLDKQEDIINNNIVPVDSDEPFDLNDPRQKKDFTSGITKSINDLNALHRKEEDIKRREIELGSKETDINRSMSQTKLQTDVLSVCGKYPGLKPEKAMEYLLNPDNANVESLLMPLIIREGAISTKTQEVKTEIENKVNGGKDISSVPSGSTDVKETLVDPDNSKWEKDTLGPRTW